MPLVLNAVKSNQEKPDSFMNEDVAAMSLLN